MATERGSHHIQEEEKSGTGQEGGPARMLRFSRSPTPRFFPATEAVVGYATPSPVHRHTQPAERRLPPRAARPVAS